MPIEAPSPPARASGDLLTGATGFVGSHFLFGRRRAPGSVWSLVRARTVRAARQRLRDQLERVSASYGERASAAELARLTDSAVVGDIARELCGVAPKRVQELRRAGVHTFWHFAASLAYSEGQRAAIERSNVDGTRNAVELARAVGARRFVYVSTAYTVGRYRGSVGERLHPVDGAFNNSYERSKCRAEHGVVELCRRSGLELSILRPGIVVGPRASYDSGGTRTGLYGFISALCDLSSLAQRVEAPLVLEGDGLTPIHLIPVDNVVRDMQSLEARDFAGGPIFHLTSTGSVTAIDVLESIQQTIELPPIEFGGDAERAPRSTAQRLLHRRMDFFRGYTRDPKRFERSLPGHVGLTPEELDRYVCSFRRELAGEATPHVA